MSHPSISFDADWHSIHIATVVLYSAEYSRVVGVSANIAGHWRPDSEYHADFKSGNIFLVRLILGVHSASKVLGFFLHFCYFRFQLLISSLVEKSWAEQYSCREFVLLLFGSGNYWRLRFTKWKKPQNFRGRVQAEDQTDQKNINRFEISMIFWIRPPMSCYIGAYPYYSTNESLRSKLKIIILMARVTSKSR